MSLRASIVASLPCRTNTTINNRLTSLQWQYNPSSHNQQPSSMDQLYEAIGSLEAVFVDSDYNLSPLVVSGETAATLVQASFDPPAPKNKKKKTKPDDRHHSKKTKPARAPPSVSVAAASELGEGRVVVLSDDTLFIYEANATDNNDNGAFLAAVFEYLGGPNSDTYTLHLGLCAEEDAWLRANSELVDRFEHDDKCSAITTTTPSELDGLDAGSVLVLALGNLESWYDTKAPQECEDAIDAVRRWVSEIGGGVLVLGNGWAYRPLVRRMFERLLADTGIHLTTESRDHCKLSVLESAEAARESLLHVEAAFECVSDDAAESEALASACSTLRLALEAAPLEYYERLQEALGDDAFTINPTPDQPFDVDHHGNERQRLAACAQVAWASVAPAADITAHPAHEFFPGAVPDDAEHLDAAIVIDGSYAGIDPRYDGDDAKEPAWRSTGLYAPAGETITIAIPDECVDAGFVVIIGAQSPVDFRSYKHWVGVIANAIVKERTMSLLVNARVVHCC